MNGWRVAGFTELRELGAGAQGRVVLAQHDASGQLVAIKYLYGMRDAQLAEFRAEAHTMRRVASPHVARLYELVERPGAGAAILMEAVNGASLKALLAGHGAMPPEAALALLKGSLLGLAAAHAVGVVHRDYKPANVLVQADGVSKLIDFGIAVPAGHSGTAGTPTYQAPEQWVGEPATPATDVYAATCVFFECVTGRPPYQATNAVSLHYLHTSAPIPTADIDEALRPLLLTGMAKSPASRPGSAQAFVDQLEAVAVAAYGPDWEVRALRGLAMAAAPLIAAGIATSLSSGAAAGSSVVGGTTLATTRLARSVPGWTIKAGAAISATAAVGLGLYAVHASSYHHPTKAAADTSACSYRPLPGTPPGQLPPAHPDIPHAGTAFISTSAGTATVVLSLADPCTSGSFAYSANRGAYSTPTCLTQQSRDGLLPSTRCTATHPPSYTFRAENQSTATPPSSCVLAAERTGTQSNAPSSNTGFTVFCGDYTAHYPPAPVIGTVTGGADLLTPQPGRTLKIGTIYVGVPGVSAPTLGQPWAPTQQGFGQVMPWTFYAGGDPTGSVTSVTWTSWGGPTATGTGTAEYVGPGQTVASGVLRPATLLASNLGLCQGKLMYQRISWSFPGISQESSGFNNICTG